MFYFQFQLICNLRSKHWLAIPTETSGLQKTLVSWDLTQTDCKCIHVYVQSITMFTLSANFNQLLVGLGFNRSEGDGEHVEQNS